ncbi:MAG: cytidylate kinase-like family protein [Proteobacteria bacterium]|nr:cytidylate kinase-like family protein [Pseudomonadota bacterium]
MTAPRRLDQIVDHQVRRWEVERRATIPQPRAPCIALSRHPGSGAAELAHQVAEWLDYGCFGIEIVDQIAQREHVQRSLVTGLDEHVRSAIDRYVFDFLRGESFTETDYLRQVVQVVTTLGERGMAVILGRGAPFILPPDRALRVLVTAPVVARNERIAKEHRLSLGEAALRREHDDRERLQFLRHGFGVEPDDPSLYDVVVNTGTLSIEAAAKVVIEGLRRRFPVA